MEEQSATIKDKIPESLTIRESPARGDPASTLVFGTVGVGHAGAIGSFRGWTIVEQLPTKGAEADIFIVDVSGKHRVLKLYRHRLEPKLEILNRITEISRTNRDCFVTYYDTGFDETTGRWFELQEYLPIGSLKDVPRKVKHSQNFVAQFIPELSKAIKRLHDYGIIHCDLKPANVLVRTLEPLDLVLVDFGISSLIASDMSQKMTSLKGTPMYWAPEAFSRVIGRACDWWGFGMMMLEMLLDEHPFEGLNDSQIIRKLTLGNVDIPKHLGPDWSLLIKGLLTKDDDKRWGYDEVSRWLAGARDIPVFFEEREASDGDQAKPFQISGITCRTAAEIAETIAKREEPWKSPADYLRFIRQWYESNLMFDDAANLGNIISKSNPDIALFRFAHSNASLPFCLHGHTADLDGIYLILEKATSGALSYSENLVAQMLQDGGATRYYEEYANFGEADSVFHELLSFLSRKPITCQLGYVGALREPEAYIWPEDVLTGTISDRLGCLKHLDVPPIKKTDMENLSERFVIPDSLTGMFHSAGTYAAAVSKLELWRGRELLLEHASDETVLRHLSIDGYEMTARVRCLGHSTSVMKEMEFAASRIAGLRAVRPDIAFERVLEQFEKLRNEKISSHDLFHIKALSELFTKRDEIIDNRMMRNTFGGIAAVAVLSLVRYVFGQTGSLSNPAWTFASFMLLMGTGLFYMARTGLLGDIIRGSKFPYGLDIRLLMLVCIPNVVFPWMLAVAMPEGLSRALSLSFPFFGAPLGALIADITHSLRLKKNLTAIINECDDYLLNENTNS
jgi:serine/threonine protein kinase